MSYDIAIHGKAGAAAPKDSKIKVRQPRCISWFHHSLATDKNSLLWKQPPCLHKIYPHGSMGKAKNRP